MDWVVAPVLQRWLAAEVLVNITSSPAQNTVGPSADIVGTPGFGLRTTLVAADVLLHPLAFVTVTE